MYRGTVETTIDLLGVPVRLELEFTASRDAKSGAKCSEITYIHGPLPCDMYDMLNTPASISKPKALVLSSGKIYWSGDTIVDTLYDQIDYMIAKGDIDVGF